MNRVNALYILTAATFVVVLIVAGGFLLRTGQPTADVIAQRENNHPLISVAGIERGAPVIMALNGRPVVLWWRNAEQMALAKEQDDPELWWVAESFVSAQAQPVPAHDASLSVNGEWFVAWALNPTGMGCIVIPKSGDFGGFFDPCRGDHFDLSGRIRKGIARQNLKVITARLTADRKFLHLDLSNPPKVRR